MDVTCPKCGKIYKDIEKCPDCDVALTRDWSGKLAIIEPENSKIAKKTDIKSKGIYSLKT